MTDSTRKATRQIRVREKSGKCDDYRAGSVDVRVGRRRLNWCNELIDWRCLRDRHRYTLETRLHVRWLSAQRRLRVTVNRREPCPRHPTPPIFLSGEEKRQVRRTVNVPNIFRSSRRLSLFTLLFRSFSIISLRRIALSSEFAARTHCRLNSLSCNIFLSLVIFCMPRKQTALILCDYPLLRECRTSLTRWNAISLANLYSVEIINIPLIIKEAND